MKIKTSFVTNSSSVCYVLNYLPDVDIEGLLRESIYSFDVLDVFENIEELEIAIKGAPFDWVEKATGYKGNYKDISDYEFDLLKAEIAKNGAAIFLEIDNSNTDKVEYILRTAGYEIISKENY